MLKFLFDRSSKFALGIEGCGVVLTALFITQSLSTTSLLFKILFWIYLSEYGLLRLCSMKRWYLKSLANRHEGIELHFKKAVIAAGYILFFVALSHRIMPSTVVSLSAVLLLGFLVYVNMTLLYLHFKDKNKTPINYFSHKKYI